MKNLTQNYMQSFPYIINVAIEYNFYILLMIVVILAIIYIWIKYKNKKMSEEQVIEKNCRILIIGNPGVGKTKLFNRISKLGQSALKSEFEGFSELELVSNYSLVDTPSIDLDSSIEKREEIVKQFQDYFQNYGHLISNMFITVNFERTDLMKGKITSVYKYFRKFNHMIGIIITDFHKSENQEEERIHLLKSFQFYKIPQNRIIFTGDHQSSEVIKQLLISASNILNMENPNARSEANENEQLI